MFVGRCGERGGAVVDVSKRAMGGIAALLFVGLKVDGLWI
jgi:hypothetical protein